MDFEKKHQEDLQRLRGFRLLDDDFMTKVFEDISCAELLLRIILNDAFVYGCIGLSYNSCLSAISTIRPKYITPMRSHKKRTTLKSWEMNI